MLSMCVPILCSLAIIPQQWNLDAVQRTCWDSMNYEHGGDEASQSVQPLLLLRSYYSALSCPPLSFPVLLRFSLLLFHLLYFTLYNNLHYFCRHFRYCVCAARSFEKETSFPTSDRKQLLQRRTSQVMKNSSLTI